MAIAEFQRTDAELRTTNHLQSLNKSQPCAGAICACVTLHDPHRYGCTTNPPGTHVVAPPQLAWQHHPVGGHHVVGGVGAVRLTHTPPHQPQLVAVPRGGRTCATTPTPTPTPTRNSSSGSGTTITTTTTTTGSRFAPVAELLWWARCHDGAGCCIS